MDVIIVNSKSFSAHIKRNLGKFQGLKYANFKLNEKKQEKHINKYYLLSVIPESFKKLVMNHII